jgi:hypothetical protein
MDAELALVARRRHGPRRLAHATVEHRCELAHGLDPGAAGILEERALRRTDPAAASRWRAAVRDALLPRLDSGWSITGFDRATGYRLEAPRPGTSTDVP